MTQRGSSLGGAGRYRLDSRIATGGMGEVWRATDTVLDRTVAVKVLKPEYADDATFRSRFETEARHAAALHHPGVAAVFDFGEGATGDGGPDRPYLVMELVDGQPLSNLLRPGSPMDPDAAREVVARTAEALGAAHAAGIVHRDVKPANIMVLPDRRVKITDFGIARAADGLALTATGQVMGTPQYLSPEQASGQPATPASDLYSLGVVLFECLAGFRPFTGDSPVTTALAHLRDPVPDLPQFVPADLAVVTRRAMAKSPEDRFADAPAFAAALRDPRAAAAVAPGAGPGAGPGGEPTGDHTAVLTGFAPAAAGAGAAAAAAGTPSAYTPLPQDPDPGRRRGTPWPWVLLALAVLALLILLAVQLGDGEEATTGTTNTPSQASPSQSAASESIEPTEEPAPETTEPAVSEPTEPVETPVFIDVDDYVGEPVQDVVAELEALELVVVTEEVENTGDEDAGEVVDVSPADGLVVGDTVTVSFFGDPPPEEEEPEEGNSGQGSGNSGQGNSGQGNSEQGNSGEGNGG